jgi:hypothetical protein
LAHGQSPTGHPAVELTAPTDGQSERAGRDKNASSTLAAKESSVAPAGDVTNSANLEAFFDGSVRVQMDTRHIAGAVVAGGKVVFMKGYGYADVTRGARRLQKKPHSGLDQSRSFSPGRRSCNRSKRGS